MKDIQDFRWADHISIEEARQIVKALKRWPHELDFVFVYEPISIPTGLDDDVRARLRALARA